MIDADTVRHVARLARLGLSAEERERMQRELSVILDHVETIQALDLEDVPPTAHVVLIENVVRQDEPGPCLDRDLALREAPATREGGFLVPRMD